MLTHFNVTGWVRVACKDWSEAERELLDDKMVMDIATTKLNKLRHSLVDRIKDEFAHCWKVTNVAFPKVPMGASPNHEQRELLDNWHGALEDARVPDMADGLPLLAQITHRIFHEATFSQMAFVCFVFERWSQGHSMVQKNGTTSLDAFNQKYKELEEYKDLIKDALAVSCESIDIHKLICSTGCSCARRR
jgi:hypothetical protein